MKRWSTVLLIGLLVLNGAACSPRASRPTEPATPPPEPVVEEGQPSPAPALTPTGEQPAPTPDTEFSPPPAPTGLNVPLQVENPLNVARVNEPVTSGVPLPRDLDLADPTRLQLVDAAGRPILAQFTPLARWGGQTEDETAPIRWVLIDFQATVGPQQATTYFLQEGGPGPSPPYPLIITDGPDRLTVDTGASFFTFHKNDGGLYAPGLSAPIHTRVRGTDGTERTTAGPVDVSIAHQGPTRMSIHVKGTYGEGLDYTSRYWLYAGQAVARVFHTVENNTPCPLAEDEQLGCYDIGSGGGATVADLSLVIPVQLGDELVFHVGGELGPVSRDLNADLLLYQDSSGSDHWDTYASLTDPHGNRLDAQPRMQSYVSFRGYRTRLGGSSVDSGDHAPGWLSVIGGSGSWTVGVRHFWQNFPKALRATADASIEIGLFPGEFGPPEYGFTLRAGEHKTHEFFLVPTTGSAYTLTLPHLHPLVAVAPTSWYVQSGSLGLAALPDRAAWPDHENYIAHQLDTALAYRDWMDWHPNLPTAIESTDFYGIFDYGDWPIDYEGYRVAPLNTKYDNDYGAWLQWVRTGDSRWFQLAEAADRHLADIDILHNLHTPRHWGDGIAFGHSYHDEDGFLNPHRNYGGSHPDTAFGMDGLLLTYYLTGYEKARESALELGDCIEYRLHNEAHLCAHFSDCSGEGYALDEGLYRAGSRPAANSLAIAVSGYRATADPRFLAVADALVDWAQAENQPYINGPTGADEMVRPWMLNMYLRALAGYLEMKEEFGLPDTHNARDSYLAYADWLRTYPWIDLEPVETGPRAAYPYEWWFDERQGDPNDEWSLGNNVPSINNWLLLGADALAYAYHLSGEGDYLERAAALFRTGTRDPWFEGDTNTYSATKETANSIAYGHIFLHIWAQEHR